MTTRHADKVRLEIDASDLTNLVANHSSQAGATTGWSADAGITLTSVLDPTRSGQTLAGTYAGRAISAAYAGATVTSGVRSPFFAVVAGRWVGVQISVADSREVQASTKLFVQVATEWYNASSVLLSTSPYAQAQISAADDSPWLMTIFSTAPKQAPASATQARVRVQVYDGGVSGAAAPARVLYVAKLMAVQADSSSEAYAVPFADTAWQNILGSAVSATVQRGGSVDGVTDRIEPGLLTTTVLDLAVDPSLNPRVRPGRAVRLTAWQAATGTWAPLFTGKLKQAEVEYGGKLDPFAKPRVTITAVDAVSELAATDQPYNYSGTLGQKVRALMAAAPALPFTTDAGVISTTRILVEENAKLWDQLLLARNSFVNAKLWVDRAGTVQCKTVAPTGSAAFALTDVKSATLRNAYVDGGVEGPIGSGFAVATTNASVTSSTGWAEQGTKSAAMTRTAAGTALAYMWPWIAPTTSPTLPVSLGDHLTYRAAVRAAEAVTVSVIRYAQPSGAQTVVFGPTAVAADTTQVIDIRNQKQTVPTVTGQQFALKVEAASGVAGAVFAYADGFALYNSGKYPVPFEAQPVPFFAGTGTFTDTTLTPYLERDVSFSSEALVNTVLIVKQSSTEPGGEKTYGPYVNAASVAAWEKITAEVDVVDGTPSTLAADYLAKYANPEIYPRSITYDYDRSLASEQFVDLYDQVRAIYSPGAVDRLLYVIGVEHRITPNRWRTTLTLRPLDQASVTVTNPAAGADTGPLDAIPGGEWTNLPLDAGWQAWGSGFQVPQYKVEASLIRLRGLVRSITAVKTATSTIATVAALAPPLNEVFSVATSQTMTSSASSAANTGAASAGTAHTHPIPHTHTVPNYAGRLDVTSAGALQVFATAAAPIAVNGFVSLSGVSWYR